MSSLSPLDLLERTLRTTVAIRVQSTDHNQQVTAEAAAILLRGVTEPFVWDAVPVQQAVIERAETLPPDARFPADPSELMPEGVDVAWWYFDPPLEYAPETDIPPETNERGRYMYTHISALAFAATDGWPGGVLGGKAGYHVVVFRPIESSTGQRSLMAGGLVIQPPGGLCNDGRLSVQSQAVLRFIVAGCTYLRERVMVTSHQHVERHRRKQIARAVKDGPIITGLRVVSLRHPEPTPHVPSGRHVEYQVQWDVRPHKRRRLCKDGRTEVEVRSYRKGPKDKPLKVTMGTVFKVER